MAEHKTHPETIQRLSVAPNAKTQRARILRLLIDARGGWVPLPDIMACAAQYNARIFELRKNFSIENRTEIVDGVRHSWFRLLSSPTTAPELESATAQPLKSWDEIVAKREQKMRAPDPEAFRLTPPEPQP